MSSAAASSLPARGSFLYFFNLKTEWLHGGRPAGLKTLPPGISDPTPGLLFIRRPSASLILTSQNDFLYTKVRATESAFSGLIADLALISQASIPLQTM